MTDTATSGNLLIAEAKVDARWRLGYTVTPDGEAWPVLIDGRQREPQAFWIGSDVKKHLAPHEGTGALPSAYRVVRCKATTYAGKPCKNKPLARTDFCRSHEDYDDLTRQIKSAPYVSALHVIWAENQEAFDGNPGYLKAYCARGKWLEREGLIW